MNNRLDETTNDKHSSQRYAELEAAVTPLMNLYNDWQKRNCFSEEEGNDQHALNLVQYIVKVSDSESLEDIFRRAYAVFQVKGEETT